MSDVNLIETFKGGIPKALKKVSIDKLHFSTICRETKEPDRWDLTLTYQPKTRLFKDTSVRQYLNSYKDDHLLAEEAGARITKELAQAVRPKQLVVEARIVPTSAPEKSCTWTA